MNLQNDSDVSNLEKWQIKTRIAMNITASITLVTVSVLVVVMTIFYIGMYKRDTTQPPADPGMIALNMSNMVIRAVSDAPAHEAGSTPIDTMYVDVDEEPSVKEGTPYGGHPGSTDLMPYVVAVDDSCYQDGNAWIYVAGFSPSGPITVQTDWSHTGVFGFGDGAYVDSYGHATFAWPCYDVQGTPLPSNVYRVMITDRNSGFAVMINIVVGDKPYYTPDPRVPTFNVIAMPRGK